MNQIFTGVFIVLFVAVILTSIGTEGRWWCYIGLHWWNKWSDSESLIQFHSCTRCGITKARHLKI